MILGAALPVAELRKPMETAERVGNMTGQLPVGVPL